MESVVFVHEYQIGDNYLEFSLIFHDFGTKQSIYGGFHRLFHQFCEQRRFQFRSKFSRIGQEQTDVLAIRFARYFSGDNGVQCLFPQIQITNNLPAYQCSIIRFIGHLRLAFRQHND